MIRKFSSHRNFLFILLVAAANSATATTLTDRLIGLVSTQGTHKIQVVQTRDFCQRLDQMFQRLGTDYGLTPKDNSILAAVATRKLIDEFRDGRTSDFVQLRRLGYHFEKIQGRSQEPLFFRPEKLVGPALGLTDDVNLVLSSNELRFLGTLSPGKPVVVFANHSAAMTPNRLDEIRLVASQRGNPIHVVWLGSAVNDDNLLEASPLFSLSLQTGGSFVDLSGEAIPCDIGA